MCRLLLVELRCERCAAKMNKVLVTGSSGLIGSEAVCYFDQRGWEVIGVDNNMRADFFGPKHSGVELHGFLNYLFKAAKEGG